MSEEKEKPSAVDVLMVAPNATQLRDYINNQIITLSNAMKQDTLEIRSSAYTRKNFTVGALLAYDPEVRRLARAAGADLDQVDNAIAIASQAIAQEMNKVNPIGQKLTKTLNDLYRNGSYR